MSLAKTRLNPKQDMNDIAGIKIPDSKMARDLTQLIRDTESGLLFHHSTRVYLFGALTGEPKRSRHCAIPSRWMFVSLGNKVLGRYHRRYLGLKYLGCALMRTLDGVFVTGIPVFFPAGGWRSRGSVTGVLLPKPFSYPR